MAHVAKNTSQGSMTTIICEGKSPGLIWSEWNGRVEGRGYHPEGKELSETDNTRESEENLIIPFLIFKKLLKKQGGTIFFFHLCNLMTATQNPLTNQELLPQIELTFPQNRKT